MAEPLPGRRPLTSRDRRWAIVSADWLARRGVAPNAISVVSAFFASGAGACLVASSQVASGIAARALLVGVAALIQLRLVCNLLDGMVAIEGGRRSATGGLFNEIPDRIADVVILVCAGYAAQGLPHLNALGWLCACLAVLTAYLRALGESLGCAACFLGPMAKPHRMAAMTVAALTAAVALPWAGRILGVTLGVIAVGAIITCVRRIHAIAGELTRRPQ